MSTDSSFPNGSYTESLIDRYIRCLTTKPISFMYIIFVISNIFSVVPLCLYILRHGVQQRFQRRSAAPVGHFHCFCYHMALIELVGALGTSLVFCRIYTNVKVLMSIGDQLFVFTLTGQVLLHVLTCVDRYLAVVHPVTYLSLRNEKGVRIRNVSIGCVWLVCFSTFLIKNFSSNFFVMEAFLSALSITIVFFCCVSVLCVLIRPGPGGGRQKADPSKQRAFYTMSAILFLLVVRISWCFFQSMMHVNLDLFSCVTALLEVWINFPSSLVMPLLFLYKEGKCPCGRKNSN